jgi:ATP-dependent 26S proteasome regulatory subunit
LPETIDFNGAQMKAVCVEAGMELFEEGAPSSVTKTSFSVFMLINLRKNFL